ncbi:hypothetical protein ACOME3_010132 [Neoechinorhynchus agilis]
MTICGTPQYMAPEVSGRLGYTTCCDWWSLGVLAYELNAGSTPFVASDIIRIIAKAQSGRFRVPEHFSSELRDLVIGLLKINPNRRYGCGNGGIDGMKAHKFFKDIDWWNLFQQKVAMIYKPGIYPTDRFLSQSLNICSKEANLSLIVDVKDTPESPLVQRIKRGKAKSRVHDGAQDPFQDVPGQKPHDIRYRNRISGDLRGLRHERFG